MMSGSYKGSLDMRIRAKRDDVQKIKKVVDRICNFQPLYHGYLDCLCCECLEMIGAECSDEYEDGMQIYEYLSENLISGIEAVKKTEEDAVIELYWEVNERDHYIFGAYMDLIQKLSPVLRLR